MSRGATYQIDGHGSQSPSTSSPYGNYNYYYYYMLPDGSVSYAQFPGRDYTPTEAAGEEPVGYVAPSYGQATGYACLSDVSYSIYDRADPAGDVGRCSETKEAALQNEPTTHPTAPLNSQVDQRGRWRPCPVTRGSGSRVQIFDYTPPRAHEEVSEWKGTSEWSASLCGACCQLPCYCLAATLCPWCVTVSQRRIFLLKNWNYYICCAGTCGDWSSCTERKGQRVCCGHAGNCNSTCMCVEAFFCLPCAVRANRFMLQKRYGLRHVAYDRAVASCMCCSGGWSGAICDCLYLLVYPCALTQHHAQMLHYAETSGIAESALPQQMR